MNKLFEAYQEYKDELLTKVTWSSFDELQSSTIVVLVASLLIALIIALMDLLFSTLFNLVQ
ncbi:MAG: preprotein translocase subunit SecE [Bacteroidia bacterium]|nr:preprotein translocase subunit SecE [Bacteroidia bacterium]